MTRKRLREKCRLRVANANWNIAMNLRQTLFTCRRSSFTLGSGKGTIANRRGIAAVEFALVMPVLATIVIGVLEINRGLLVKQILDQAARKGCETGCLVLQTNATVTSDINNVLSSNNIDTTAVTITILVNGASKNVSTATLNDKISVSVSVPTSKVSWTSTYQYLTGSTIGTG
jgi:Flp pilus assembly protein TadG